MIQKRTKALNEEIHEFYFFEMMNQTRVGWIIQKSSQKELFCWNEDTVMSSQADFRVHRTRPLRAVNAVQLVSFVDMMPLAVQCGCLWLTVCISCVICRILSWRNRREYDRIALRVEMIWNRRVLATGLFALPLKSQLNPTQNTSSYNELEFMKSNWGSSKDFHPFKSSIYSSIVPTIIES